MTDEMTKELHTCMLMASESAAIEYSFATEVFASMMKRGIRMMVQDEGDADMRQVGREIVDELDAPIEQAQRRLVALREKHIDNPCSLVADAGADSIDTAVTFLKDGRPTQAFAYLSGQIMGKYD